MKNFLNKVIAKNVAPSESVRFKSIETKAFKKAPFSINITLSNEKVEKVVRAPKNPVITKTLYSAELICSK